jgi:hypothetical protein
MLVLLGSFVKMLLAAVTFLQLMLPLPYQQWMRYNVVLLKK